MFGNIYYFVGLFFSLYIHSLEGGCWLLTIHGLKVWKHTSFRDKCLQILVGGYKQYTLRLYNVLDRNILQISGAIINGNYVHSAQMSSPQSLWKWF